MDTKAKGDIGEQAVVLKALQLGWAVLKPIGDRLPYDLVFDIKCRLVKIQVKAAWFSERYQNYFCDNRRCKTNRRVMIRDTYSEEDFDFAIIYVDDLDKFYVLPIKFFLSYAGTICLQPTFKRQRKPKAEIYLEAWDLINEWAAPEEIQEVESVKVGEAVNMVIPSQALNIKEGVET